MPKLLYITANTKPENLSSSKTVGRALVNRILSRYPEFQIEEVDLYEDHIPQLKYSYFEGRNKILGKEARSSLPKDEQKEIDKMNELCEQFISGSVYVLAAPMWSLSFPAPVKEYLDCIIQSGKTLTFTENKPKGLLGDNPRTFIYVQASGASIPLIIKPILNKGQDYVIDIMKTLGISKCEELLVDGTGTTEEERQKAITQAEKKIESIVNNLDF